jgi:hypothetical protein
MITKLGRSLRDIPAGVWALGFVSMLMDTSSETIHALLPVYLVTVLGTSMVTVGIIEGIAEATASITKVFSGALSDWLGKRKMLAVIGYGLAALTKPVFPLAPSVSWLVGARFLDRIGKGIRGAPRDALVADIAPADLRGASFGLRQSLDTTGAFLGPLLAIGLMWWTANNFTAVFWVAVIPAFLALALIIFAVHEPERPQGLRTVRNPISLSEIKRLGAPYWWVIGIAAIFTLARFSEAFLILRAQNVGVPIMLVPAVCPCRLSRRRRVRSHEPDNASDYRFDLADWSRSGSRAIAIHRWRRARCRVVGIAHGVYPRAAGDFGGRYVAAGTSRHCLWIFQSARRVRDAGCKCDCRVAMGYRRSKSDVSGRSGLYAACPGRTSHDTGPDQHKSCDQNLLSFIFWQLPALRTRSRPQQSRRPRIWASCNMTQEGQAWFANHG